MIRGKFEELSIENIDQLFVGSVPESQVLEYKREFGDKEKQKLNISREICAMANTYGGHIVFGIEEDKKTTAPKRYWSIKESISDLQSRLTGCAFDRIEPPVQVEGRALPDASNPKVFVVRVPESDMAPHATDDNTNVYIKVRDQKRPVEASVAKVEWLRQKRVKSIEYRDRLLERLHFHMDRISPAVQNDEYVIQSTVCPEFPTMPLFALSKLRSQIKQTFSHFSTKYETVVRLENPVAIDRGVCGYTDLSYIKRTIRYAYFMDVNGCVGMRFIVKKFGEPKRTHIEMWPIAQMVNLGVGFGLMNLSSGLYRGSRRISLTLNHIAGTELLTERVDCPYAEKYGLCKNEGERTISEEFTVSPFEARKQFESRLSDFFSRIFHVYGVQDELDICAGSALNHCAKTLDIVEN